MAFGDDGSFDSDDPTFTAASGASIEAIVLYVHTGTESTSRLIMYQDTGVSFAKLWIQTMRSATLPCCGVGRFVGLYIRDIVQAL
jgi:hypothetical protein